MAYDTKRLKAFKWLESLATNKARYSKGAWNQIPDILTIYGRVYATNGIILASVEYPEFEHLSDYGWMIVSEFCGEDGYLLERPILEEPEITRRERFFEDYFIKQNHFNNEFSFDPAVMKDAMYLFSLYGINCHLAMNDYKLEFSGHNKDVSIRVVMMGVR